MKRTDNHDTNHTATASFKFTAYAMLYLSFLIGAVSLLVLWIFFFTGSIDFLNLNLNEVEKFVLNTSFCLVFFIQHSTMIRKSFRSWLQKHIRTIYHGAFYSITSGAILLILVAFWQTSTYNLITLQGILRWLMRAIYFLSIIGYYRSIRALRLFDAFGVMPILRNLKGKNEPRPVPFSVRGPYRWVRHPLYFYSLLAIWSCPDLTADRLLFNILWTLWIIIGTVFEERDLVASFGEDYRKYQRKVPMLIPRSIRPLQ